MIDDFLRAVKLWFVWSMSFRCSLVNVRFPNSRIHIFGPLFVQPSAHLGRRILPLGNRYGN